MSVNGELAVYNTPLTITCLTTVISEGERKTEKEQMFNEHPSQNRFAIDC
jgi:hypothetical protein